FLGSKESQIGELASIPGLEDVADLSGHELEVALEIRFARREVGEWVSALNRKGLGAYALNTSVRDLMKDPWVVSHGLSVTQQYQDGSQITTIGPPWRMSRTPVSPRHLVSPPGGDALEVLASVGMAGELSRLVESKAVVLE